MKDKDTKEQEPRDLEIPLIDLEKEEDTRKEEK